jgi:hypothetical protein
VTAPRHLVPLTEAHMWREWCTPRLARRLVARGDLAHHRIGRRVYLDLVDLDEYVERHRVDGSRPRLRAIRGSP